MLNCSTVSLCIHHSHTTIDEHNLALSSYQHNEVDSSSYHVPL